MSIKRFPSLATVILIVSGLTFLAYFIAVGLIIDKFPAHTAPLNMAKIKLYHYSDQLVLGYLNGDLTSVLQVCDLIVNKDIKNNER